MYARGPVTALLLGALMLPVMSHAQGLRPSMQLSLPNAAFRASAASGPDVQRQADFIVAVVNSDPITNNEVRTKLIRAEQQLAQQGAPLPARS